MKTTHRLNLLTAALVFSFTFITSSAAQEVAKPNIVFVLMDNLILDPKEEFPVTVQNTWAVEPMTKMIAAFELTTRKNPLIAPGTPDPYKPTK